MKWLKSIEVQKNASCMNKPKNFLAHPVVVSFTLLIAVSVAWAYWPKGQVQRPVDNSDPVRVLFVGNSHTKYNNLRGLFAALAKAGDKNAIVGEHIIMGSQLSQHLPKMEQKRFLERGWDYVVLQEQSLIPAIDQLRNEKMLPVTRELDKRIRSNGGQTVLFLTWGRRDGAARYGEELADYSSMQARITAGIEAIGKELDVDIAPVGKAWEQVIKSDKDFPLWDKDGSHPAPAGSYLAACVFYAQFFDQSPEGLAFHYELSKKDAAYLQNVAANTVLGENESRLDSTQANAK